MGLNWEQSRAGLAGTIGSSHGSSAGLASWAGRCFQRHVCQCRGVGASSVPSTHSPLNSCGIPTAPGPWIPGSFATGSKSQFFNSLKVKLVNPAAVLPPTFHPPPLQCSVSDSIKPKGVSPPEKQDSSTCEVVQRGGQKGP